MTNWTEKYCEVNGINIHYRRTGGDKPPVVLLHGLLTNGACWIPLARTLEGDYDVIMPDARGHGKSSAPTQGYTYDNLANDVLGFIEALRLNAPVLIGHSMGGLTAAVVASRYPQGLRGLVLADPTFLTPKRQLEVYESDVVNRHGRILSQPQDDFLADIRMRHTHRSSEIIELLAEARFQTSIHALEILMPPNPDYVQLIKNLEVPSLLVIGDVDVIISPEMASELAKLNQCVEIVQIAEAGHGLPYDQPKHFSACVKSFLRSLSM